jgi:hypothetical protein
MIEWLRKRSAPTRVLIYAVAAILAFAAAAGVGATTALIVQGDLSMPTSEEHESAGDREAYADQSQQEKADYVSEVGDLQAKSTQTFLDSHDRLVRYDALNVDDIEEMQANQAALQEITEQVANLHPPQKHREQYEVFRSAINELHQAVQLAYNLAADPVSASQSEFDEYERHVNEAAAGLQRSNDMLGRDYQTLEGVREVSPS